MVDRVPAAGSCLRCQDALGLASVKRDEAWFCSVECADGRERPAVARQPRVAEEALYSRPRRFFAKRRPKELR